MGGVLTMIRRKTSRGNNFACPHFVIPGRGEAASPESSNIREPIWIPGSRAYARAPE
jgi:hypothetical protein